MSDSGPEMQTLPECAAMQEIVPAYAYADVAADERAALEAHLVGCAACRAALAAVRATGQALDRLTVPSPGEREWDHFESRLEARVAPLRAEKLAERAAKRHPILRMQWAGRIAATVLFGGLSVITAALYMETRDLRTQLDRELADRSFDQGEYSRAWLLYNNLVTTGHSDQALKIRVEMIEKLDGDRRPLLAYKLAQMEFGDSQRRRLADLLWSFPRHRLADEVFNTLQKRPDATPRPLEIALTRPISVVGRPLPGGSAVAHYAQEIERLKRLATPEQDPRFNEYALFRAARVAEEELGDPARAIVEYRNVVANTQPGPIRDAAKERLAEITKQR